MSEYTELLDTRIRELEEERDNLAESRTSLMEALAPFAAFWNVLTPQDVVHGDDTPVYGKAGVLAGEVMMTAGDIRRAHIALEKAEEE